MYYRETSPEQPNRQNSSSGGCQWIQWGEELSDPLVLEHTATVVERSDVSFTVAWKLLQSEIFLGFFPNHTSILISFEYPYKSGPRSTDHCYMLDFGHSNYQIDDL